MHEGLWQVAAELALVHVVFLGLNASWPAGGAVALEPPPGTGLVAEGMRRQCHPQPGQQEGTLGLVQGPCILAEPVHEAVFAQFVHDGLDGRLTRGSSGPAAPRMTGSRSEASTRSSSGVRCHRPVGCPQSFRLAMIWSARPLQFPASRWASCPAVAAMARRPATQASRE
jgi:hypothetical protein